MGNAWCSCGNAKPRSGSVPTCQGTWNACWTAFQGGGPRLKVQTVCLGDQTHRSACRKHARSQGHETCHPGGFCRPGGLPGRHLAHLGTCQRAWTRHLACLVHPVDATMCPMRGTCHRAGNMSGDIFLGDGPLLWAQTMCPGLLTRRRASGEDPWSQGHEATVQRRPGSFHWPGAIGSTLGTSEDVPEGMDTPFGVSGASF